MNPSTKLTIALLLLLTNLLACKKAGDSQSDATELKTPPSIPSEPAQAEEEGAIELTEAQFKTAGIRLGRLEERSLSGLIRVNGVLSVPPQQQVSVSTPYGGILISTPLLPGQSVRKGQTLAVLENPEFIRLQQEYLETASQLTFQQQEFERQRELSQQNVTALKSFQQATAQLGTFRARAEGLRQQLGLIGISMQELATGKITRQIPVRSPIAGTVTEVRVNRGRYVAANDVLFDLIGGGPLYAELTVFENDIAQVQVGQRVRLLLIGSSTGERMGRIRLINHETRPDRTVRVYASLDQPGVQLRPGTYLRALVETGAAPQPALPEEAIVQNGTQAQVFVFDQKEQHEGVMHYRFRPLPVQAGVVENGYRSVQLGEPLKPGTQLVVAGAYDLLSAMNNAEEEGGHDH